MELVKVEENQFTGLYMRYNIKPKVREILPPGYYLKDGDWFYSALEMGKGDYEPSSKHAYIEVEKNDH